MVHNFEVMEEEAIGSGACCMDVNESGAFLLGFISDDSARRRMHVNIYRDNGEYETGISFVCNGQFWIALRGRRYLALFCQREGAVSGQPEGRSGGTNDVYGLAQRDL